METEIDVQDPIEIDEEVKGEEGTVGNDVMVQEIGEMEWNREGIV
jgi:hypothetical protein